MKIQTFFETIKAKFSANKNSKYASCVILILIALIALLLSSVLKGKNVDNVNDDYNREDVSQTDKSYASNLESRLESFLSAMDGVGKVDVMLLVNKSGETIIATEEQSSMSDGSVGSKSQKPAILNSADGEETIVLAQLSPEICGVIVVAEGGGDIAIKLDIISAVSTVLGITQNNVQVFKMSSEN